MPHPTVLSFGDTCRTIGSSFVKGLLPLNLVEKFRQVATREFGSPLICVSDETRLGPETIDCLDHLMNSESHGYLQRASGCNVKLSP